ATPVTRPVSPQLSLTLVHSRPATHAFPAPSLLLPPPPSFSQPSLALRRIPLPAALSPCSRKTTCPVKQVLRGISSDASRLDARDTHFVVRPICGFPTTRRAHSRSPRFRCASAICS